jgi:hypothetical protein
MPADHVPGKPRIGTFVDYYNPRFQQRIGFTEGYGKRYDGPYAAIVTNNLGDGLSLVVMLPDVTPMQLSAVPHKDKAPTFVATDGTNHPGAAGNGYWDWQNQTSAARAAKELKAHTDALEEAAKDVEGEVS